MTTGDVLLVHEVQLDEYLHCAYWQCHKDVKIASAMFILDGTRMWKCKPTRTKLYAIDFTLG